MPIKTQVEPNPPHLARHANTQSVAQLISNRKHRGFPPPTFPPDLRDGAADLPRGKDRRSAISRDIYSQPRTKWPTRAGTLPLARSGPSTRPAATAIGTELQRRVVFRARVRVERRSRKGEADIRVQRTLASRLPLDATLAGCARSSPGRASAFAGCFLHITTRATLRPQHHHQRCRPLPTQNRH